MSSTEYNDITYEYKIDVVARKRIGYSPQLDVLFVYWVTTDDIIYSLGENGTYQVAFIENIDLSKIVDLGEL